MTHSLQKILVVEDEPDIGSIVKIALESSANLQVELCTSGDKVFETLKQYTPDLILMNVMIKGMDGLEVIKLLKQSPKFAQIPIVFLTARTQPNEIKYYLDNGAIDVIAKPFDPLNLATHVKAIWEKWTNEQRS